MEYKLVPVEPTEEMLAAVWSLRSSNSPISTSACYQALLAAAPSPSWIPVSERLQAIHSALDESLGDSDIDWIETDEEMREEEPVQWAATELAKLIHELEPRQQPPEPPREGG